MIQALNSVNMTANCCNGKRKQSFGNDPVAENVNVIFEQKPAKRPSTAKRLATYAATNLVAGALVSSLIDGGTNVYRAIAKNKPLMSLKQVAANAGSLGVAFALIGLVFTAISAAMTRGNK